MHDIMWIHMTSHPLFMISHHAMTFTYTLFMWSYPGYLSLHPLQLSYYLQFIDYSMSAICVISNHYIYMTSYEFYVTSQPFFLTSKDGIHDITSILFLTTDHCIRHAIHYTCDITATVTMTRHLLCFWHDTQCIWDLTQWMSVNTMAVSDMIPNVSL